MADQLSIVDKTANPAPLGLMGFGMTTVLLNLHNANIIGLSAMILAMGIFYGGAAQVLAGIMEWKKGNTFATTAFTSYGMFWLTLVALWILPDMGFGKAVAVDDAGLAAYLFMWGPVYPGPVHRHFQTEPRPAGSIRHPGYPVLPAGL